MEDYLIGIGKRIRQLRKEKNLLANEVAQRAGVSNGLISRIENGRTIPSVPVLFSIIGALDEEPARFFEGIRKNGSKPYVVIRPDDQAPIEKEQAEGFAYSFITSRRLSSVGFEAVLLTVLPGSQRETTETDAYEFKYVLEGTCEYVIGEDVVELQAGDALFFDGRIPHLPRNRGDRPARMLVLYLYTETGAAPDS